MRFFIGCNFFNCSTDSSTFTGPALVPPSTRCVNFKFTFGKQQEITLPTVLILKYNLGYGVYSSVF